MNVVAVVSRSSSALIAEAGSVTAVRRRDQPGAGDQAHPERDEADVELAARRDDVAVDVRARDLREDRLEAGRVRGRREELGDAHVRRSGHAGLAVAPRLPVRPGDDLAVVRGLAEAERLPDALGRARPSRVHGQLGVAALDQVARARAAEPAGGEDALVVRRDGDDHGQRFRDHRTVRPCRLDQVGAQHDPVVHRDGQIRGGDRLGISLGPWCPVQPARAQAGPRRAQPRGLSGWWEPGRHWHYRPAGSALGRATGWRGSRRQHAHAASRRANDRSGQLSRLACAR